MQAENRISSLPPKQPRPDAKWAEEALLESIGQAAAPAPIFILGAPRTGSTVFYQALCSRFSLPCISNLTNDCFAETPIVGLAIQKAVPAQIGFESRYGKTTGPLQPSEGSAVMTHWFGGGHPSALVSVHILEGMESHFLATLAAAETLFGAPLVIKNAWNCFRLGYLSKALPSARFIWIRRDIAAAAKSDMASRYETKGSAAEWNSATPANIEKLLQLPPAAQVIENQHEFNVTVGESLNQYACGRWREVWYEDFVGNPDSTLAALGTFLCIRQVDGAPPIAIARPHPPNLPAADAHAIEEYLAAQRARLSQDRHTDLR